VSIRSSAREERRSGLATARCHALKDGFNGIR
jgi:hypothetical protein